jgi:membrane associated rhomboid family serine protease
MLEDRDYMREPDYGQSGWQRRRFGLRWSLTVCFLIAYVAVFVVESMLVKFSPVKAIWFYEHFALSNEGLAHGQLWQLLTYQFMHSGFLHLFFNGWAIYFFGLALESDLGKKRFAALMLSSGIIGGVLQSAVDFFWPHYFGGAVVGASACAFGLVAAFAALYPTRELTMLVFFIIPVTVAARTLLIVSAALALIGFGLRLGNVAHAAHLGGMVMGFLFVRMNWQSFRSRLSGRVRPVEQEKTRRPKLVITDAPADKSFLESEVDPILDKISAHGIESLTSREREVLENARKKMTRS